MEGWNFETNPLEIRLNRRQCSSKFRWDVTSVFFKVVKARVLEVQDNPLGVRLKEKVMKEHRLLKTEAWEGGIDEKKVGKFE